MAAAAGRRGLGRGILRGLAVMLALLLALLLLWAASVLWAMRASRPVAEGSLAVAGVSKPVTIARDSAGVPVVRAATRADAAFALGFLHGQERFFQMDTLRRSAAGEISELLGPPTLGLDRMVRVHRFRARARAIVAGLSADERALLDAYVAGVNAGLGGLGSVPFEYRLLLARPQPWQAEDSILAVFAMYLNLQPAVPQRELDRARATARMGPAMADLLYAGTTPLDAPVDFSRLPEPPLPGGLKAALPPPAPGTSPLEAAEAAVAGSNNWAVAGRLSTSGAALVANDMHLGLSVPGTWYRARLVVAGPPALDATGVTLPGVPFIVAGSTGRIAWGFTNSYIDTADAVIIEETRPGFYRTPAGEAPLRIVAERIGTRLGSERLEVRETIWGPVVGTDALGRTIAMRWTAHLPAAVRIAPFMALEQAGSVAEAISIAHGAAMPQQNLVVGDAAGNIGWTIIGVVPERFGFSGQDAVSLADGTRGWRDPPDAAGVPVVVNPADGRLWTANARVIGGAGYVRLGDGGYDTGARAMRIRDLLFAKDRFAPADFLEIQLDDVAIRNRWWQQRLLAELAARKDDPLLAAMVAPVADWGERAVPGSAGYRLVERFRRHVVDILYEAYMGGVPEGPFRKTYAPSQAEGPVRRLLEAQPPALVPPGLAGWPAVIDAALARLATEVRAEAGGDPAAFTWGKVGVARVRHPLTRLLPPLGWLTDPPEVAVPGDRSTVRAQAPGFGASERFAVSPGHEAEGLFHMPGSQAGNPRAPWYLQGHQDWVEGRPSPFLPGPPRWTLTLAPVG